MTKTWLNKGMIRTQSLKESIRTLVDQDSSTWTLQNDFLSVSPVRKQKIYETSPVEVAARIVNLKSDTCTQPTPAMRAAMAKAVVGDDLYGLDPTANELQAQAAEMFGKEAGLFVSSGTMGNLVSVLVHCEVRGSEVIIGSESHIYTIEQGGIATLGGVYSNIVPNKPDGTMDLRQVEAAIHSNDVLLANTRLICLENTHNRCGGRCISAEYTDKVGELARRYGLKLHVDGARIFNAATALGISVKRLVKAADSVQICLSKGLGSPVGSLLVGSHEFIDKARRLRKALGGGMRQIGVLCAPGLISLHEMSRRLDVDHKNARALAEGLKDVPGLQVDPDSVQTNIVNISVTSESPLGAKELCGSLQDKGIIVMSLKPGGVRLVTHYHITRDDVQYVLSCFQNILLRPST